MEQDPMRALWLALAEGNGIDASQIRWVPLSNAQKPDALAADEVDAALNPFLHNHLNYEAVLGRDLGVIWWHELGFSMPGHVLVAGTAWSESAPEVLGRFVAVTQRAWRDCLVDGSPCVDALVRANPQLDRERETALWRLVRGLSADAGRQATVGAFGDAAGAGATALVLHALRLAPGQDPVATERFLNHDFRLP
jgi:NitT/TauT family transport system substrate-binding protein